MQNFVMHAGDVVSRKHLIGGETYEHEDVLEHLYGNKALWVIMLSHCKRPKCLAN